MKLLAVAVAAAALSGCAALESVNERTDAIACNDPLIERFARLVLANKHGGSVGILFVARDCDGDGRPDDLGRWVPPDAAERIEPPTIPVPRPRPQAQ